MLIPLVLVASSSACAASPEGPAAPKASSSPSPSPPAPTPPPPVVNACETGAECGAGELCMTTFCGPPSVAPSPPIACPGPKCVPDPCAGATLDCACAKSACSTGPFCNVDATRRTLWCGAGG
ncbi:MAG: hypothetical protein U0414_10085 [Polyangiaceae bacterium]